jgi:DNA end-binding protein Ku
MSAAWKPADYRDDFRDKLHKFIQRRIAKTGAGGRQGHEEPAPTPKEASNVVDFMALLKKSLAAKGGKGSRSAAQRSRAVARRKPRGPVRRTG